MNFKTKEEFTQSDLDVLRDLGFITHTGCPYYELDEFFSIILNPCKCSETVVVCVLNEYEAQDEYIYPLFEAYKITLELLGKGLILLEE